MKSKRILKFKDYARIFFVYGLGCAVVPIIVTELFWDGVAKQIGLSGLPKDIIESFFRAALLEEGFKFFGFYRADKNYKFISEKEFMLGAGTIGLAYAVVEKLVTGNAFAIILGILFPMHILWQMNQGRHFFAYRQARKKKDNKTAKKELFMATFVIFLMHGCWDAVISLSVYLMNIEGSTYANIFSIILILLTIAFGIFYMITTIKKAIKVFKNDKK